MEIFLSYLSLILLCTYWGYMIYRLLKKKKFEKILDERIEKLQDDLLSLSNYTKDFEEYNEEYNSIYDILSYLYGLREEVWRSC